MLRSVPDSYRRRPVTVLYVDDEASNTDLFSMHLEETYRVLTAGSGDEALRILEGEDLGVVVTDERMPGMSGVELLARVQEIAPLATRMVISAYSDAPVLMRAIQTGRVHDYMTKPWDFATLVERIGRAVEQHLRRLELFEAAADRDVLRDEVRHRYDPGRVVGETTGLRDAITVIEKVALSDTTALIRGESGTGKELLARAIHERGHRRDRAMVAVNCAALPPGLVESELFGHERGAFTGATTQRIGRFEQAHRGTLFLDEVGDLPPAVQVKLLRVLQEGQIERVGGNAPIDVDVRVIAATHHDLEGMVDDGRFREDLFYRLNVVPIEIPPLRARRQDIPELARYFLARYGARQGRRPSASPEAIELLLAHDWPGNVRELENIVERAVVLSNSEELGVDDFRFDLRTRSALSQTVTTSASRRSTSGGTTLRDELKAAEAARLAEALRNAAGNVAAAARAIGIARTTFHSKARKHGLL